MRSELLREEFWRAERSREVLQKVALPSLYAKQIEIAQSKARYKIPCIGRRAGKTFLSVRLLLETACQGWPAGWFTPNHKDALEVWATLARTLKPVATKINSQEKRIELINGGVVECWTMNNNPDAGRSRRYKRVVIDEAAKAPLLKEAWLEAIRPTLTDFKGDAIFPSTPKGLNYFYELFQQGLDPREPLWQSWQLPSVINPFLDPAEIEQARKDLPQMAFEQEYLAQFIQDAGAVFRNVEACLRDYQSSPSDHRGHVVVAGVDLAQKHDFTAVSIYCCTCNQELHLDRWNMLGWEFQRGRLLQLLQSWRVRYALVEKNSIGSPNLEALWQVAPDNIEIIGFDTTPKSKPGLIQQTALEIEKQECFFLNDPIGKHELLAYECEITATGHPKYSAPEGGFDDTVIARCLTIEAKRRNPLPPATFHQQVVERLTPYLRSDTEFAYMSEAEKRGYMMRIKNERSVIEEDLRDEEKSDYARFIEQGE